MRSVFYTTCDVIHKLFINKNTSRYIWRAILKLSINKYKKNNYTYKQNRYIHDIDLKKSVYNIRSKSAISSVKYESEHNNGHLRISSVEWRTQ